MSSNSEFVSCRVPVESIVRKMSRHRGPCITLIDLFSSAEFSDIADISTETQALTDFLESEGYSEGTDLSDKSGEPVFLAITQGVPDMAETLKALKDACRYFGESDVRIEQDGDGGRYCIVPYSRKELVKDRLREHYPSMFASSKKRKR